MRGEEKKKGDNVRRRGSGTRNVGKREGGKYGEWERGKMKREMRREGKREGENDRRRRRGKEGGEEGMRVIGTKRVTRRTGMTGQAPPVPELLK